MNENYKITSVSYSSHVEIEDSDVIDFTNKIGVPHSEVTYLRAHISFEYMLGGKLQYGTCYDDVIKLGTVVYDTVGSEIKAVEYIPGDPMPSASELNEIYEGIVANEYNAIAIEALKYNYSQEYLSEVGTSKGPIIPVGCLIFRSPNSFTLKTNSGATTWDGTLEYSTDTNTWTTWGGTEINSGIVSGNNDLYLRGTGNTKITVPNNSKNFVFTGSGISIIGNIENLLDYQTVLSGNHPSMANNCYMCMFWECTELTSISLDLLPATTLSDSCYSNMFGGGCTSLNTLPRLAAVTLEHSCYSTMFANCTSIKLSATQVDDYQIPYRIPAEGEGTSATNATLFMFAGTGGTFKGISVTLNKTYYTSNQVI